MRLLFSALTVALLSTVAFANSTTANFEYEFNRLSGVPAASKYALGTLIREAHNQAVCVYDFATLGAATSAAVSLKNTDLKTTCTIPGKAIILNGFMDTTGDVHASGGAATIKLQTAGSSANLLTSSTATSGSRVQLIPDWATLSDSVKLGSTASYAVQLQSTSGTLTSGHLRVFLNYVQGE